MESVCVFSYFLVKNPRSQILTRYNVRANAVAYGWIDTRITRPPTEYEVLTVNGEQIKPGIPLSAKKWRDVSDIPLGRPGTAEEPARASLPSKSTIFLYYWDMHRVYWRQVYVIYTRVPYFKFISSILNITWLILNR
jgi:hypothetical protein